MRGGDLQGRPRRASLPGAASSDLLPSAYCDGYKVALIKGEPYPRSRSSSGYCRQQPRGCQEKNINFFFLYQSIKGGVSRAVVRSGAPRPRWLMRCSTRSFP